MTNDRDNEALVTFLQALALAITDLDEGPPKNRTAARFLRDLDRYAGRIVSMAEQDGSDIGDAMRVLRQNLATALRQAKLASKQSTGGPH